MLSIEIVRIVEEFDGWNSPHIHGLRVHTNDGPSASDLWEEAFGYSDGNEIDGLRNCLGNKEQEVLKEILKTEKSEEDYAAVSQFIRWILTNYQWDEDAKDCLRHRDEYDYFVLGKQIGPHSKWCETTIGRISFYEKLYQDEYFEKMLPLYVQSIRDIIERHRT